MYLAFLLGFGAAFYLFGYLAVGTLFFGDISLLPESSGNMAERVAISWPIGLLIILMRGKTFSMFSDTKNGKANEQFMFCLTIFTVISSIIFAITTAILYRPLNPDLMFACMIAWFISCLAAQMICDTLFSSIGASAEIIAYPLLLGCSAIPLIVNMVI